MKKKKEDKSGCLYITNSIKLTAGKTNEVETPQRITSGAEKLSETLISFMFVWQSLSPQLHLTDLNIEIATKRLPQYNLLTVRPVVATVSNTIMTKCAIFFSI